MSYLDQRLQQGIAALGLDIPVETQARLIRYIELIDKWNRHFNLTAVRNLDEMVTLHLLDSLAVVPYLTGRRILDVGAGAGLPGMVLAMVFPNRQFTLLDTNGKKTRFMTQARIELGLNNVEVVQARINEYIYKENGPAEPFDTIISRAFASISDMLGYVEHLVTETTQVLAMKGDSEDEISQLPETYKKAFQIDQLHELEVPGLQAKRQLLVISRIAERSPV